MPFGPDCEYADMDACIAANQDKDDPGAYCAVLMANTEEYCKAAPIPPVRVLWTPAVRSKLVRPDIKVLDAKQGRIHAVVSTETPDRDGDIIRVAGWDLDNFLKHPVLLSSHNYQTLRSQIGEWESMDVKGKRLEGIARYYIGAGNDEADWGFHLAEMGKAAYSVGFKPDMSQAKELGDDSGSFSRPMEFNKQELLEVSHVTIPANADALQLMGQMKRLDPVISDILGEMVGAIDVPTWKRMMGEFDLMLVKRLTDWRAEADVHQTVPDDSGQGIEDIIARALKEAIWQP